MTHRVRMVFVATLVAAGFSATQSAFAQTQPSSRDEHYVFPDDPLAAGFFGPNDVHIRVVPTPKRSTLIRPRVQFVVEMLKSVETL